MSPVETIAFGTLWIFLLLLGALVLVLYRQVEKAYTHTTGLDNVGLPPGIDAPDLEVITEDGVAPLDFSDASDLTLVAFLRTSCDACVTLAKTLRDDRALTGRTIALVSGEDDGEFKKSGSDNIEVFWLAHPPDATRSYGVNLTPLVYIFRGRTVLAARSVHSRSGIEALVREARDYEAERGSKKTVPLASSM